VTYETFLYEKEESGKEIPVSKTITAIFIRKLSIGGYKGKSVLV
jgi:hypothetical protein